MIYKNIHQIWLQGEPPGKFSDNIDSVKHYHSDWKYILWNEEKILSLLKDRFDKRCVDMWVGYPNLIQKCDAARHFILYAHGGLYVDMDILFLRSIDKLLQQDCVLFRANPADAIDHDAPGKLITNSIYYAMKNDKFMGLCIKGLYLNKDRYKNDTNPGYTSFHTTAGGFITKMYEWYNKISNIHVHSHKHFELLPQEHRRSILINDEHVLNKSTGIHMSVGDWYR